HPPSVETALCASVLLEVATVPGGHRGLCLVAPLVAGAQSARPVKSSVKRQKNDATDAEAICEAVTRANMRFVATKRPTETMKRLGPQNRVRLLPEGERELCPDTGHCSHKSSKLYFILNNIKSCALSDPSVTCHSSLNNASERSAPLGRWGQLSRWCCLDSRAMPRRHCRQASSPACLGSPCWRALTSRPRSHSRNG